jgi:hypothetical protein
LRGDLPIGGRVPGPLIDTVENAHQPVGQPDEGVMQPESAASGAKLLCLGRAHGGDKIGERQPSLEKVDFAVPLELLPVVELPRQADVGHDLGREVPLVSGIVDRQHSGKVAAETVCQRGPKEHKGEGGVPVVGVQQYRPRNQAGQGSDGG